jgi:acyl carrier protein
MAMSDANLEEILLRLVNGTLAKYAKAPIRRCDESLVESGRLDSLLLIEIIFQLEDQFDFHSGVHGFKMENFETIELIARQIRESRKSV